MHWILPFATGKNVDQAYKKNRKKYDHKRKKIMSMDHFKKAYNMLIIKYLYVN